MNQERGEEREEGFEASYAGSKVALKMPRPPAAEHSFGGVGGLQSSQEGKFGVQKTKKIELVACPDPSRSQGREGMDEELVPAPALC